MWSLKFGKVVLEIFDFLGPNCILECAFILVQSLLLLSRSSHNRRSSSQSEGASVFWEQRVPPE